MKIYLLLAFCISIQATQYETVPATIKIDKEKQNWIKLIKKEDTRFGFIPMYSSVLLSNKNTLTLDLFTKNMDNKFYLDSKYNSIIGKNSGDKKREGDKKTPIGIYTLTEQLNPPPLPFYGPLAFITSYPNIYDKYLGKTGYGIWIHGFPFYKSRDPYTRGCVAINNVDIKNLSSKIDIDTTIYISQNRRNRVGKKKLLILLSWLYEWKTSWQNNDIDKYISFYANNFKKNNIIDLETFKKYKKAIFAKRENKSIIFENLLIMPYPNKKNIYIISFDEKYISNNFKSQEAKTLMVLMGENIKIFLEISM